MNIHINMHLIYILDVSLRQETLSVKMNAVVLCLEFKRIKYDYD